VPLGRVFRRREAYRTPQRQLFVDAGLQRSMSAKVFMEGALAFTGALRYRKDMRRTAQQDTLGNRDAHGQPALRVSEGEYLAKNGVLD
jgi:hypothetical protein